MAFEDTLRLLINTALLDGVFDWSSDSAQGGAGGCAGAQTDDPSQPDKGPVQIVDISPQSPDLDNAMNVSDGMRTFLMGHKPGNNTYAKHYHARMSMVDFPFVFRGLDQVSTLPQGSVLLNRSDNAPLALSSNGLARVMALPDVVKEDKKLASSREKILQEYTSIDEARRHADLLAAQRYYEDGYKEHFANLRATPEAIHSSPRSQTLGALDDAQNFSAHQPTHVCPSTTDQTSNLEESECRQDHRTNHLDGVADFLDHGDSGLLNDDTLDERDRIDSQAFSDLIHLGTDVIGFR
ncbi:hypothetical protein FMUND_11792 [Fusarium mundagurra]|uniref:Uncharacterized protein n=1 Tax=Fusarium mundagurra TaxID=1567541 RepID=A0A8H5Y7G5_9HYPO|nr:hypothetical protein FMUND_11792 [Fusarium mundagurra]